MELTDTGERGIIVAGGYSEPVRRIAGIEGDKLEEMGIDSKEWQALLKRESVEVAQMAERIALYNDVLGITDYSIETLKMILRESSIRWISCLYHHRNARRHTGEPYSVHLLGTAKKAIEYGFIEIKVIDESMAHDVFEDIEGLKEEHLFLDFFEYLGLRDIEGIRKRSREVIKGVLSITKPPLEDPDELNQVYLLQLVKALIKEASSVLVKLFDRDHNLFTIDGHRTIEKRRKVAKESLEVFIPIAHKLGLYDLEEEMVRYALPYVNPKLLDDYDRLVQRSIERLENNPRGWPLCKNLLEEEVPGILEVKLQPHRLVDYLKYVDPHKLYEDITLDDLGVRNTRHAMIDISIEVDEGEQLAVIARIQKLLINKVWNVEDRKSGEVIVRTHGPLLNDFGYGVAIHVNSARSSLMTKRGHFQTFGKFDPPDFVKEEALDLLREVKETGEDIRVVARRSLLYRPLKIEYWLNGDDRREVYVKKGTTCIEFLRKLVGDEGIKQYQVVVEKYNMGSQHSIYPPKVLELEDEVPRDHVILVNKIVE